MSRLISLLFFAILAFFLSLASAATAKQNVTTTLPSSADIMSRTHRMLRDTHTLRKLKQNKRLPGIPTGRDTTNLKSGAGEYRPAQDAAAASIAKIRNPNKGRKLDQGQDSPSSDDDFPKILAHSSLDIECVVGGEPCSDFEEIPLTEIEAADVSPPPPLVDVQAVNCFINGEPCTDFLDAPPLPFGLHKWR